METRKVTLVNVKTMTEVAELMILGLLLQIRTSYEVELGVLNAPLETTEDFILINSISKGKENKWHIKGESTNHTTYTMYINENTLKGQETEIDPQRS